LPGSSQAPSRARLDARLHARLDARSGAAGTLCRARKGGGSFAERLPPYAFRSSKGGA